MSIANPTNPTFNFFLGHGWLAYLGASVAYLAAAFLILSMLPRMAALMAAFAILFGHFFGTANWLCIRWHLGMPAFAIYGALLGAALASAAFPEARAAAHTVKRLRWVMLTASPPVIGFIPRRRKRLTSSSAFSCSGAGQPPCSTSCFTWRSLSCWCRLFPRRPP
jgi:hypothetical protein